MAAAQKHLSVLPFHRTLLEGFRRKLLHDPALKVYGALLTFVHFISGLYWLTDHFYYWMTPTEESICWPLVPACDALRIFTPGQARLAIAVYMALAVLLFLAFIFARRLSWPLLAAFVGLWVVKFAIIAMDYRFRHNVHYMHFFISLAYVVGLDKPLLCRWQLVLFYFWAGTLKLNAEWLTGGALYKKPFLVPETLIPAACFYVVVLELVLVWGLLLKKKPWIYWSVLFQLLVFHAVSWGSVGFFYPTTMFCLLGIFIFEWPEPQFARRGFVYAYCLIFSCLQLIPRVISPDSSLTGEGRLLALHMFDAQSRCVGYVRTGAGRSVDLISEADVVRLRCDPIVVWNRAKSLCRENPNARIDLFLASRRTADPQFYRIVDEKDFCRSRLEFSIWRKNSWIQHQPYFFGGDGVVSRTRSPPSAPASEPGESR
jgi:hypothetical protein